jgi:hypothetical protein
VYRQHTHTDFVLITAGYKILQYGLRSSPMIEKLVTPLAGSIDTSLTHVPALQSSWSGVLL